jgi:alcohol dehydrogenase
MLGAAHAAANPLTAHYGVVHGEAVGVMLPAVVRFNAQQSEARQSYRDFATSLNLGSTEQSQAVDRLVRELEQILNTAQIARSLVDLGVPECDLPILANEAATQWTARFNPRPVTAVEFQDLYSAAMERRR